MNKSLGPFSILKILDLSGNHFSEQNLLTFKALMSREGNPKKLNLSLFLTIDSISTKFSVFTPISIFDPEEISNVIRLKRQNFQIPNLSCFMFRSRNEPNLDSFLINSEFQFIEDNESKFVALQLKNDLSFVISMKDIIYQLINHIQKILAKKYLGRASRIIFSVPMLYTSIQRREIQECLKNAGVEMIDFVETTSLIAIECSNQIPSDGLILIGNWTESYFEAAIAQKKSNSIDILDQIGYYSLGVTQILNQISSFLAFKVLKKKVNEDDLEYFHELSVPIFNRLCIENDISIHISLPNHHINQIIIFLGLI